jgi:hypothetical protein
MDAAEASETSRLGSYVACSAKTKFVAVFALQAKGALGLAQALADFAGR